MEKTGLAYNVNFDDNTEAQEREFSPMQDSKEVLAFPLNVFPELLQEIVNECYSTLQFPIDFIATAMLSATAVSFGNYYHVKVKEQHTEPAVFYMVIAGNPGVIKTASLNWILEPLKRRDAESYREFKKALQEQATDTTHTQARPVHRQTIETDFTLESIISTHQDNPKGLIVHSDEIMHWIGNFNKYNKGNDETAWLSFWSGKNYSLKRKTSGSNYLTHTNVNVLGGIQIERLRELLCDSRKRNGFIYRLMFTIPNIQKKAWDFDNEFNAEYKEKWDSFIGRLYDLSFQDGDEPKQIGFSTDARELLFAWQSDNTSKVIELREGRFAELLSKWECYLVRLALVLQVMHDNSNHLETTEINIQSVEGAIELHNYFISHISKVMTLIDQPPELDGLESWKKQFIELIPDGDFSFDYAKSLKDAVTPKVSESSIKLFLKNRRYFRHLEHGKYRKLI